MNKNLLEVGNNTGDVSDENGYVKIVHKDSNDWEFKEILELENDLDYLHKRLTMTKNNLDKNKKDSIAANIWSACILVGEVFVYMVLHKQLPLSVTIAGMVCFYTFIKGFSIIEHGTRFTRHIKKKRLIERLEKTEEKIPLLEKELKEKKEKVNYKVSTTSRNLEQSKEFISSLPEYTIEDEKEIPVVAKDLILTRKK